MSGATGGDELACPPTIAVSAEGPLTIVYRYRDVNGYFGLAFSIVGFLGLAWCCAIWLENGESQMGLIAIGFFAPSAVLFYTSLAGLLNRAIVTIDSSLHVRYRPLPWPGSRDIPIAQLRQLSVRTHRGGRYGTIVTHSVDAKVHGVDTRIVGGLARESEARFIQRTIERHLATVDGGART